MADVHWDCAVDLLVEPCRRQLYANTHGTAGSFEQLLSRISTGSKVTPRTRILVQGILLTTSGVNV
jgi:hypothetical protein